MGSTIKRLTRHLYLILLFAFIILLSAFIIELVKRRYAQTIGYKSHYSNDIGRLSYSNPDMQTAFKHVKENHTIASEDFKDSAEWQELVRKDRADRAKIEIAGKLVTFSISAIGLLVYVVRRRNAYEMSWLDWLSVILGLVFMGDVLIHAIHLLMGFVLCQEASLWQQFNLPVFTSITIYNVLGLVLFSFILYKIPKPDRIRFIMCGLSGTIVGGSLWLFWVGDLLL